MTDDERDDWQHLSCILEVDVDYPEDLYNLYTTFTMIILLFENALKMET